MARKVWAQQPSPVKCMVLMVWTVIVLLVFLQLRFSFKRTTSIVTTTNSTDSISHFIIKQMIQPTYSNTNTTALSFVQRPESNSTIITNEEKLYKWEPSGIDIRPLLRFINDSYIGTFGEQTFLYDKLFGPVPAFVVNTASFNSSSSSNMPQIWIPTSVFARRQRKTLGYRLRAVLQPLFHQALSTLNASTAIYPALAKVMQTTGILPLALQLDDFTGCSKENYRVDDNTSTALTLPVFSFCVDRLCPNTLLIPAYESVQQYARFETSENWTNQFDLWQQEYPWDEKIPKLFWRGSCTHHRKEPIQDSIRSRIAYASLNDENIRDLVDIFFASMKEASRCSLSSREQLGYANRTPAEWSMKYRAVLDMDGNAWSERFPRLLCYNSVVVKMTPRFVDHQWSTLEPWVHYIPVTDETFANISKFVTDDDNQMVLKQIVNNANSWCSKRMTKQQLRRDFLHVLNGYVEELDRYDASWLTKWKMEYKDYIKWGEKYFFSEYPYQFNELFELSKELVPTPQQLQI